MAATADSVRHRIDLARSTLTPAQMAIGLGLLIALTYVGLFMQEPLAHDSLHNARHAAGITCH
jgi:hypothetical protein